MNVQTQTLLTLQTKAQANLTHFISGLNEAERETSGTSERWSAKDLVAHISNWWSIQGERFAEVARGNISVDFAWSDEVNETLFTENANHSWEEVIDEMTRSSQLWQAAVKSLKGEDLLLQDPREKGEGSPLWRLVLGNGYLHPCIHLTEHYLEQKELTQATALQEEMAEQLLSSLPQVSGLAHYNLACFYAQMSREEDALKELQRALSFNPTLKLFAQQDEDFKAIQTHERFQALLKERN